MFGYLEDNLADSREKKNMVSEWFLRNYEEIEARDIYRWLWEGEYGGRDILNELTLDRLTDDIRAARIQGRRPKMVWEPLGLALTLVKVNLVPYADSGCPLKKLLQLEERGRDVRPNPMRMKQDWALMKAQLSPGMAVSLESINNFENSIAFHLIPEVDFSDKFLKIYGHGYRIVPRIPFFTYFPEYKLEEEEKIIKLG